MFTSKCLFRIVFKDKTIAALLLILVGIMFIRSNIVGVSTIVTDIITDNTKMLWEIYSEVKEMGNFPNEDFIKRQFHIGDEDDTNQNIHVFVLIQEIDGVEKMTIQVTYLKTSSYPAVGVLDKIKNILCSIKKDDLKIESSDFSKKEMNMFLKDLKHSISDKKRLLGLIKKD